MPPRDPAQPEPVVRTFRQGSGLAAGGVIAVLSVVFLVLYLVGDRSRGPEPAIWAVVVLLVVWAVLLRPSVRLSEHGVTLRNVLRDVHLTWPAIDLVEARWALTLVTPDGEAYSAWAISAQRPKRAPGPASSGGRINPMQTLSGALDPSRELIDREASAGRVGEEIRRTVDQYALAVSRGDMAEQEVRVDVRPAVTGVVAVALAVALAVFAVLT